MSRAVAEAIAIALTDPTAGTTRRLRFLGSSFPGNLTVELTEEPDEYADHHLRYGYSALLPVEASDRDLVFTLAKADRELTDAARKRGLR